MTPDLPPHLQGPPPVDPVPTATPDILVDASEEDFWPASPTLDGGVLHDPRVAAIEAGRLFQRLRLLLPQALQMLTRFPVVEADALKVALYRVGGQAASQPARAFADRCHRRDEGRHQLAVVGGSSEDDEWATLRQTANEEERDLDDVVMESQRRLKEDALKELNALRQSIVESGKILPVDFELGEKIEAALCPEQFDPDPDPDDVPPPPNRSAQAEPWETVLKARRANSRNPYGWYPARPGEASPDATWLVELETAWQAAGLSPSSLPSPATGLFGTGRERKRADAAVAEQRISFATAVLKAAAAEIERQAAESLKAAAEIKDRVEEGYLGLLYGPGHKVSRQGFGADFELKGPREIDLMSVLDEQGSSGALPSDVGKKNAWKRYDAEELRRQVGKVSSNLNSRLVSLGVEIHLVDRGSGRRILRDRTPSDGS